MNLKRIVIEQYKEIVDNAGKAAGKIQVPDEGWIKTVRTALNMSVQQLARRLSVTRAYIYKVESAESTGGLTLKKMKEVAEALECRFVYAFVPENYPETIDEIVERRARMLAFAIVSKTHHHMALEDQALTSEQLERECDRVVMEILRTRPSSIWD